MIVVREGLAWWSAQEAIEFAVFHSRRSHEFCGRHFADVLGKHFGLGKVHAKRLNCVRIVINGGRDPPAGLSKTLRKATSAGEQIDATAPVL